METQGKMFINTGDGLKVATVISHDHKEQIAAVDSIRDATPAEERAYKETHKEPSLIDSFRMGWRMSPEQYDEYKNIRDQENKDLKERRMKDKELKKKEKAEAKERRKQEKADAKAKRKAEAKPSKFNPLNWFGKKEEAAA